MTHRYRNRFTASIAFPIIALLAPLLCLGAEPAPAMQPFAPDWRAEAASPASVADLLEKPAGAGGFVHVQDGHLFDGHGHRVRLWGVNIVGRSASPARDRAVSVAAHLAACGVNCVRFHMLDGAAPNGLIVAGRDDTAHFDADAFDRFDFFVAELKKQGIYTDLNLNVARRYKAGDGVQDADLLCFAKILNYFDPQVQKLHRQFAQDLLTHKNAYTGFEYRHEPAVALVEMVNENSIVEAWVAGRLLGKATQKNPGTWTDITKSYETELTARYNAWLGENIPPETLAEIRTSAGAAAGQPMPRLQPRELAGANRLRYLTEARFYVELERDYFAGMGRFLRSDLHVEPLLLGTADHGHAKSGYPLVSSTQQLDVVDGHVYWQHPNFTVDSKNGHRTSFSIANTAMVDDPLNSTPVQLSRSAVAGKPYIVSEVNHPFPAEHGCEGIPILAAYAAMQDWDGIFWFALDIPADDAAAKIRGHFDIHADGVKISQLSAGALMFLRGDVAAAKETRTRAYTKEQVLESLRLGRAEEPYFTPGFPLDLPLMHAVRVSSFDAPAPAATPRANEQTPIAPKPASAQIQPIRSDTGQLSWQSPQAGSGLVTIDAPSSQAMIGYCGAHATSLTNLSGKISTPFAAITLSALDRQPISRASRLLLTAGARTANHAMRWNDKRTTLEDWGKAPVEIEPVEGEISLRGLEAASSVAVQPLDGAGQPMGAAIVAGRSGDAWNFALGQPATTTYVIEVKR